MSPPVAGAAAAGDLIYLVLWQASCCGQLSLVSAEHHMAQIQANAFKYYHLLWNLPECTALACSRFPSCTLTIMMRF